MIKPKILIVGEAWGENEQKIQRPFVGAAGAELYRMLCEAGFPLRPLGPVYPGSLGMLKLWDLIPEISLTNVFNFRPTPTSNNLDALLGAKRDYEKSELCLDLPPVRPAMYLKTEHRASLDELFAQIESLNPNLILALGNTACWALLKQTGISKIHGTIVFEGRRKILPVYHPSAVLRNWSLRTIAIAALFKARAEMESPEFSRKRREIWIEPGISDLWRWWDLHGSKSDLLSVDIETERFSQISEIGFASDDSHALHLPFITAKTKSYWKTVNEEIKAWKFVHHVMTSPIPKLGQNFLYDMQYLWAKMGIPTKNFREDTMLLHHALYPGMQKSLGFLGSVYSNEPSWKHLRHHGNKEDE